MPSRENASEIKGVNAFLRVHLQNKMRGLVLLLVVCVVLFASPCPGSKDKANEDTMQEPLIPSSLLIMDSFEESYALVVEKHTQKLYLYGSRAGAIDLIKTFTCSTGENGGDKKKAGDRKTPEGIYFFTKVYEDEELPSRYGVRAFVLDYPNVFDWQQNKGGNGIWLHGTDKPLLPNDSRGCIALTNQDVLELSRYITLYCTPLIITKEIEYLTEEEATQRRKQLGAFVRDWHHSWEKKKFPDYISCYAQDFTSQGMNWSQWKKYKNSINKRNTQIDIAIEGLQGFAHNGNYLAIFMQDYHSSSFESEGVKRLYLSQRDGNLKIVGERWSPLQGGYLTLHRKSSTLASGSSQAGREDGIKLVKSFIEQWKTSWERKEFERYMSCYSVDFRNGELDRKGWEEHKRSLNRKYKTIEIGIANTQVAFDESGQNAEVSFLQNYKSDCYSDRGMKTMELRQEDGAWRIVNEMWTSL